MSKALKYPPFARPGAGEVRRPKTPAESLPSIDDFLDELPPIDDFLATDSVEPPMVEPVEAEDFAPEPVEAESAPEAEPGETATETGWAPGQWQSYNWSSLSALTPSSERPAQAWGESEWPDPPLESGAITPHAEEIAQALDGIARRIRSGELVIDNLHGTPPEAAMAAALAILLRMRG